MTIDWSLISGNPYYLGVADKLPRLGKALALDIRHLVKGNVLPWYSRITCIGHSLGAHLCGFISKHLPHILGRISGELTQCAREVEC